MENTVNKRILVLKFLNLTEDDFSAYLFELGIENLEWFNPDYEYLSKTRAYWHYAEKIIINFFFSIASKEHHKDKIMIQSHANFNVIRMELSKKIVINDSLIKRAQKEQAEEAKNKNSILTSKKVNIRPKINLNTI